MIQIAKSAFYEIGIDMMKNRLYLKIIGFWRERSEVPRYIADIRMAVQGLIKGFTIVSDLREMKAPGLDVGPLHEEAQKILVQAGLDRTAEVHADVVTQMATNRYAKSSAMKKDVFTSLAEAEKWLNG